MTFFTFGELVVTLLKILTRTRKRVISRDIRPAIIFTNSVTLMMIIMIFTNIITKMMMIIIVMIMMMLLMITTMLTWYNVWWDEERDPGNDNKKAGW